MLPLDDALDVLTDHHRALIEMVEEDRRASAAYAQHADKLMQMGRHNIEVLNQRADELLRRAARREQRAEALNVVMRAARIVAEMEKTHGYVPS